MPITLPSFNRPLQQEVPDVLGSLLSGYKMSQEPQRMRDEAMKAQLVNEMMKMQNQYYPQAQQQKLDMGDIDLQTGKLNLGALPQSIRDKEIIRGLEIAQEQRSGKRDERFGDAQIQSQIQQRQAAAERAARGPDPLRQTRTEQLINSHQWNSMPATVKERMVALANGMGIRPDVFVSGMTQGKSFEQIAQEKGLDPEKASQAKAKYLATSGNVKLEIERQKKVAELNVLEDKVSDAMAPYIRTFAGKSPKFIVDSFAGKNTDAMAKYLAARALQPEMGALRINVMGGQLGQGAINELIHSALGKSDIPQSLITPEVYKKMNHYVNQWLNEASKAATDSAFGNPRPETKKAASSVSEIDPFGIM